MGRLTPKLTQTASKVAETTNEDGDIVYGATTSVACLYRDISTLQRDANREYVEIDGLLWFDADNVPAKGDMYLLDGQYLRIERVIVARDRLHTNAIQFHKCEVTKQRQIS
jgi:hypothetical protein